MPRLPGASSARTAGLLLLFLLVGCDLLPWGRSASLEGSIGVGPIGTDGTADRGGVEILLLAPGIRQDLRAVENLLAERVAEEEELIAGLRRARAEYFQLIADRHRRTLSGLRISHGPVRISNPELDGRKVIALKDIAVSNSTKLDISFVLFDLYCGSRRIPLASTLKQPFAYLPWKSQESVQFKTEYGPREVHAKCPDAGVENPGRTRPWARVRNPGAFRIVPVRVSTHGAGGTDLMKLSDPETVYADQQTRALKQAFEDRTAALTELRAKGFEDLRARLTTAVKKHTVKTATADPSGNFVFQGLRRGSYVLSVTSGRPAGLPGRFLDVIIPDQARVALEAAAPPEIPLDRFSTEETTALPEQQTSAEECAARKALGLKGPSSCEGLPRLL